jgi:ATP-dependent Clp protease ATP-binding subunit ClpA
VNQKEGEDTEAVREQVMDYVNAAFRPEFLNRLDEIILCIDNQYPIKEQSEGAKK